MKITPEMILGEMARVSDRQEKILTRLEHITRLLVEGIDSRAGFSPEATMSILGISDLRTLERHAKSIKHKGSKFTPEDFPKLRSAMDSAKKRPHLKK